MYFFRADGNEKIGAGHLMRCLTIAQELAERVSGEQIVFLCADALSGEMAGKTGFFGESASDGLPTYGGGTSCFKGDAGGRISAGFREQERGCFSGGQLFCDTGISFCPERTGICGASG